MNREHKYKDKDEYKDKDKDKDAEKITESLTVCYILWILMTQAFQEWCICEYCLSWKNTVSEAKVGPCLVSISWAEEEILSSPKVGKVEFCAHLTQTCGKGYLQGWGGNGISERVRSRKYLKVWDWKDEIKKTSERGDQAVLKHAWPHKLPSCPISFLLTLKSLRRRQLLTEIAIMCKL